MKTHSQCRARLCIGCWKLGSHDAISPKVEKRIKAKIYDGYSRDNEFLPSVICSGCRRMILCDKPFKNKIDYDKDQ